ADAGNPGPGGKLTMGAFKRPETRATGGGFEAGIPGAFEASATATPRVAATAALEAASGLVARSLATATVKGPARLAAAVTPAVLAQAGRSLVRQGEQVFEIDVDPEGMVRLHVAGYHDVYGPANPEGWTYRVSRYGPSGTTTRHLPAVGVVHFRYLTAPSRPWCGVAPLAAASIAGRLSAETAHALADEVAGPRGSLLPLPVDGNDPSIADLKTDIKTLAGRVATVESARTMHPGAAANAPQDDWKPRRLGANPPDSEVMLLSRAFVEVVSACGCPAVLFEPTGDGTARREAFRQFLHATLQPLGDLIGRELSESWRPRSR
ncbi:MAG: hypothetical protein OXG35_30785, partial [Acidobacteria bacterium]|nr:hypothetical protein [Acidobacteriota bacterium]